MNPSETAHEYLANPTRMEKYHKAIAMLKESGFEEILRRLGEPTSFALDDPNHLSMSAFEHAERRGWYQALEFMFSFAESMHTKGDADTVGDYGAKARLEQLGYTEDEINA